MAGSPKFTDAEKAIGKADAAKRRTMPANLFLDPVKRLYPWKTADGKPSRALLLHAEERADANNRPEIAGKARAELAKLPAGEDEGEGEGEAPEVVSPKSGKPAAPDKDNANGKPGKSDAADSDGKPRQRRHHWL